MTRTRIALLAVALWPAATFAADLPKLIEQLADPDYATREAASKRLNDLGAPALTALRTAAESGSPERAERAAALVARITRRIENEQALAPTVVELPATEQTVRELFDAIEKQSRVQLRINGDQAILTQKVTPAGGKKPFWEQVQDVAAKVGLGVAEVLDHRPGSGRAPAADWVAKTDNRVELDRLRAVSATTARQVAILKERFDFSKDAAAKEELGQRIDELKEQLKELSPQIEKLEQKLGVQPPLGHVVLRAATKPAPASVCGAVRVEATPASADVLKRYTPGHLPLAVKVYAEPKLEWYRVTETVIIEATGPDGRPVAAESFTPKSFSTLANDELQFRRAKLGLRDGETATAPATAGVAALAAPAAGKPLTLKSVRGVVRGTVWTEPGEIVAVELGEKGTAAVGGNGRISMEAKVVPWNTGVGKATTLEVTLQYNPTTVRPVNGRVADANAIWLENGPGGRAVPVRANSPAARPVPDMYGLLFADADDQPLDMSHYSVRQSQVVQDGRAESVLKLSYHVRDTPANAGRAVAKVSFHGSQQKAVSVPFTLADVTLTPGTGDGQPLPEDYERAWKR